MNQRWFHRRKALTNRKGYIQEVWRQQLPGFAFNWPEPFPVIHCWYVCIVMFRRGEVHWYFVHFMYSVYCLHAALDSGQSCRPARYLSKKCFVFFLLGPKRTLLERATKKNIQPSPLTPNSTVTGEGVCLPISFEAIARMFCNHHTPEATHQDGCGIVKLMFLLWPWRLSYCSQDLTERLPQRAPQVSTPEGFLNEATCPTCTF